MSPSKTNPNTTQLRLRRRMILIAGAIFATALIAADTSEAFAQRSGRSGRGGGGSSMRSGGSSGGRSMNRSSGRSMSRGRSSGISRSNRSGFGSSRRSGSSFGNSQRSFNRGSSPQRSSMFGRSSINRGGSQFGRSTQRSTSRNRSGISGLSPRNSNRSGIRSAPRSSLGSRGSSFGNRSSISRRSTGNRNSGFTTRNNPTRRSSGFTSRSGNGRSSLQSLNGRNGASSRRGNGFVNRSSGFRNGSASRSGNFGNTRFGRNDSSRRNAFGNHSINYGQNQRRFGNRGINYDRNRGGNNARFRGYGRGFSRFGFGRRPYRSFAYGGFGRSRFRVGPVFYGHHFYRPWYPYYRRGINLNFGFGFYGGCYDFPAAYYYPSYYPAYVAPAYVGETVVYADYDDYDNDTVVVIENDDPDVLVLDGTSSQAAPRPAQNALPPNYDPNNPMILKINEGAEKFGQGQYPDALRLFEEVALQDRQNADAWFALATASFATNDYRRSASAIREGIQVLPDMVNNVFDIRDRYGNMDDFQRHIESLERHVEANQSDVDAHIVLGFVYHFTGQRPWANEVFKYVETISPNDQHLTRVFLNAKEIPAEGDVNNANPNANNSGYNQSPPPVRTNQPTPIVTRTPPQSQPQPVTIRVFEGSVSDDGRVAPKRLSTIDGIVVEFDDVDDDPLEADFKVFVGSTEYKFEHVRLGSRVSFGGLSGRRYILSPIAINKEAERVSFTIQPE